MELNTEPGRLKHISPWSSSTRAIDIQNNLIDFIETWRLSSFRHGWRCDMSLQEHTKLAGYVHPPFLKVGGEWNRCVHFIRSIKSDWCRFIASNKLKFLCFKHYRTRSAMGSAVLTLTVAAVSSQRLRRVQLWNRGSRSTGVPRVQVGLVDSSSSGRSSRPWL